MERKTKNWSCSAAVPSDVDGERYIECGLMLDDDGRCPRPWGEHVSRVCGRCPLDAPHSCKYRYSS